MTQETMPAGRLSVAYYATDDVVIGGVNTPEIWMELAATVVGGNLADVSLNTSPVYANTNTRENVAGGFTSQKPVLANGEVTFEILHRTRDPYAATDFESKLLTNSDNNSPMAMGFFDYAAKQADLTNPDQAYGLIGNWYVAKEKQEAIEDVQRWSITLTAESEVRYVTIVGTP
jgi:hypothetical protein